MPGKDELLEKWREQQIALNSKIDAVKAIEEAQAAAQCDGISTAELCEEFSNWADAVTLWLYELWDDLYGEPGTVDPPPKPPFKG